MLVWKFWNEENKPLNDKKTTKIFIVTEYQLQKKNPSSMFLK